MKLNMAIAVGILLILAIAFCLTVATRDPFHFVVFLLIVSMVFSFPVFFLGTVVICRLLPATVTKSCQNRRLRDAAIVWACFAFLYFVGGAINHFFLPGKFHPMSLLANAGILLFTVFLGMRLVRQKRRRGLFIGTAVFALFILLVVALSSISFERDETRPASTQTLQGLPYIGRVPAEMTIDKAGVTKYDDKKPFEGLNIYTPATSPTAYLMDMHGDIVHTWSASIDEEDHPWTHVEMCRNGDLLVVVDDTMLMRVGWDSTIKWVNKMRFHHDVAIAENKDVYSLIRRAELRFVSGLPVPVLNDYIVVLSPEGNIKEELSLFEMVEEHIPLSRLLKIYCWVISPEGFWQIVERRMKYGDNLKMDTAVDVFHTNNVEILARDIDDLCNRGDILISVRELNLIAVVDAKNQELRWTWGHESLSRQHNPSLLENGHILVFDNGVEREHSRVVEVDPLRRKIVWEYKGDPPDQFYSSSRGSSQRLPNGNTLITESDRGHVFEISREGQIVWEFYTHVVGTTTWKRETLYRMARLTDASAFPDLKKLR